MNIVIDYDSSAPGPAGFKTAVQAAVGYFDRLIANPITVTIKFSYGALDGSSLSADALGESSTNGNVESYSSLVSLLTAAATSQADFESIASLPATDPTNGAMFWVSDTQAKIFGLGSEPGYTDPEDGFVALGSGFNFTYNPDNRAVAHEYDAIGVMEHEISEALGRISYLGDGTFDGDTLYSPMDLFRYSAPGVHDLNQEAAYFSVDGQHLLYQFNDPANGGDGGDWSTAVSNDSFDAFSSSGVENTVSLTDIVLMDVLGFTIATPTENDFGSPGTSDVLMRNTSNAVDIGSLVGGQLSFTTVSGIGSEWTIVGEGNFLGDSFSEYVIHSSSGALSGALEVGEVVSGATQYTLIGGAGPEWTFEGSGYFLDTQYSDLLMRNTSGALDLVQVTNGQAVFTSIGAVGSEWQFWGNGNFLGDTANAEFLMHNTAGALDLGQVVNGQAVYTTIGGVGSEWTFEGVGNFLNEGRDDFLMRNSSGVLDIGDINNGVLSFTTIGGLGPEWHIINSGDYSGAGIASFLVENVSGPLAGELMLGTVVNGSAQYQVVSGVGPEWSLFGDGANGHLVGG